MRQTHIVEAANPPSELTVLGETVQIFGQGDFSKRFEVHIQEGEEGGGPPPHFHPWDEAFYVLEGEVEVTTNHATHRLGPGGYVHIPAGTVHAYTNKSSPTKLLAVVSDSRGGALFEALDAQAEHLPKNPELINKIAGELDVHFTL